MAGGLLGLLGIDTEQTFTERLEKGYNDKIAQPFRDTTQGIFGGTTQKSPWYQPETVTDYKGKTLKTNNKSFNNLSSEELTREVDSLVADNEDEADGTLYELYNPNTGETKYGRAGGSVWERYQNDMQFQQNWTVKSARRMKDVAKAERLIHGNRNSLDNRAYDYGHAKDASLNAGGTEIYTQKSMNVAKRETDRIIERTNVSAPLQELQDSISARTKKNIAISKANQKSEPSLLDLDTYKKAGSQLLEEVTTVPTGDGIKDFGLGASIAVDKVLGGITGLLNKATNNSFEDEAKFWEERANINYEAVKNKDGASQALGEIVPDLLINPTVKGKIAYDAITQGLSAMAPEAIKMFSKSNKIGLEATPETVVMAGGLGSAMGAIMSKFMKVGTPEKVVETTEFKEATPKEQEIVYSLLKEVKDGQTAKHNDFKANPPKSDLELVETTVKGKPKVETREISTGSKQRFDKKGNKIQDTEGLDILSSQELSVHHPLKKADQTKVKRLLVKNWNEDFRGRKYSEESSLLSAQGGDTQKATLKLEQTIAKDAQIEVERRLKIYDDSQEIRRTYGQNQARYKGDYTPNSAEAKADRIAFEREQYKSIAFDKNLPKEVKKVAHQKLAELKGKKVTEQLAPKGNIAKAKAKIEEANKPKENKRETTKREKDISEQYKTFLKGNESRGEGFRHTDKEVNELEIESNIINNGLAEKSAVARANKGIQESKRAGAKPKPDDVKLVKTALERRADVKAYKNGDIDIHELRYREEQRLDAQEQKTEFNSPEEVKIAEQEKVAKYEAIGITKKEREFTPKDVKKGVSTKEKESNEKVDNTRITKESIAKNYEVGSKKTFRNKTTGKNTLREDEMDLLDAGVSPETVGKLSSSDEAIRAEGKAEANKIMREDIGIENLAKVDETKRIHFKDETIDASSQAYQIFTMLTGDAKLAGITKTIDDASADLRVVIANEMNKMDLPKSIKDKLGGSIEKAHVKPLVMLKSYGQGTKSAVKEFAKTNKLSIQESEVVVEAFTNALGNKAKLVIEAMDAIYSLQKGTKGNFTWTLPNGRVVKYTENAKIEGKLDKKTDALITDESKADMGSRGLMPNIVHSIDGYIVGEIAKRLGKPIQTIHDAMTVQKGVSSEVQKIYNQILSEILEKDLLHSIMKDLGYKGQSLQKKTLKPEQVKNAKNSMELEHIEGPLNPEGKPNLIKKTVHDDSRVKNKSELMRDYMTSLDHRDTNAGSTLDEIVNEQMHSSLDLDLNSPFERAIYFAKKGPRFTEKMIGETPKGVNEKVWKDTQMELFEEARRKLEFNTLLGKDGEIKGNRLYTNEDGTPVGNFSPTEKQLIRQERKLGEKRMETTEYSLVKKEVAPTYKEVKEIVYSWKPAKMKRLNVAETQARDLVKQTQVDTLTPKGKWTKFKEWFKGNEMSTDFRNKFTTTKVREANIAKLVEDVTKDIKSWSKELQSSAPKHIVQTDYQSIFRKGIDTEAKANRVWESQETKVILERAGKEIEQTARGIGVKSEQFGYFKNNAHQIAKTHGFPTEAEELIDSLITIQAIKQNNSWKSIEKMSKDKDFDNLMDMLTQIDKENKANFVGTDTDTSAIKGYQGEVFNKGKRINEKGKAVYDGLGKDENGVIPREREKGRLGTEVKSEKPIDVTNQQRNRLKQTGDKYFKIVDEETRVKAGKTENLAETLSRTFETNSIKQANRSNINETLSELATGKSELYSTKPQKGMVKLSKKEMGHLPQILKKRLKYVNEDLKEQILGREEVRLFANDESHQAVQLADRLLKNLGTMFKQNVVLKNVPSYVNATVVNQTTALVHGVNPKDLAVWQKEAVSTMMELRAYETKVNQAQTKGKRVPKNTLSEEALLLQELEASGLSTNKLEGVVDSSKPLLQHMVGSVTPKHVGTVANNILLNQGSLAGKAVNKVFTAIDTTGRYVIAKKELKNGKPMNEAVDTANGLFADMNRMVYPWIERMDSYLGLPFVKWASLSAPMALKVAKKNPVKAMAMMVGIYILSKESGKDFQSQSPTTQFVDMLEQYITKVPDILSGDEDLIRTAISTVIPAYMQRGYDVYEGKKTVGEALKTNTKKEPKGKGADRRGATQKLLDLTKN